MPHERIYSLDGDPNHPNNTQVAWGHPSSPSNTGPGHGNDEGHVMVIVERPGTGRMPCSVEEMERQMTTRLEEALGAGTLKHLQLERIDVRTLVAAAVGMDNLVYAFGAPLDLLAVTIDRKGCNKMISALRRGRDAAFGRDE